MPHLDELCECGHRYWDHWLENKECGYAECGCRMFRVREVARMEAQEEFTRNLMAVNDRAAELVEVLKHPELLDEWVDRASRLAWADNYLTTAALALVSARMKEVNEKTRRLRETGDPSPYEGETRMSNNKQTTRCFVCGDEQWVGTVERGQDCRRLTPEGLRCCGRYVGLYQPRQDPPPSGENG